jgi:dTDP-4-amino-4,6-dideoxygalactose transaminase
MGDAGAIVTKNHELALKCRMLGNHGGIERYEHGLVGFNSRLDGLQAAILRIKLAHLDEWNQQRKKVVRHYRELLDDPRVDHLTYPESEDHVHHLFVVRVSNRDQLMHDMHGLRIGTAVHYPVPLPFLPPYGELGFGPGDFPQASQHAKTVLSLPIFPLMKEGEVQRVAEALKKLANANP